MIPNQAMLINTIPLLEAKDTDILTPVECLFLWTEYKNPNPIDTKKK